MLRSMYAAVAGLRGHQTMMDTVGNNISNVNTTGYKKDRATFEEALVQTMRGATAADEAAGGTNPHQLGLGTRVGGTDTVFTDGSTEDTGRNTDLAISGEGFFALEGEGGEVQYSRAGAFSLDEEGSVVDSSGRRLLGYPADAATGEVDAAAEPGPLQLPMGDTIAPTPTTEVRVGGNLDAAAEDGTTVRSSITAYDGQGEGHQLSLEWTKVANDEWDLAVSAPADSTGGATETFAQTFDEEGQLTSNAVEDFEFTPDNADPQTVALDFAGATPLQQYEGSSTAEARGQDGSEMGFLRGFDFGADGTVTGRFSNGESAALGAVAMANFDNPGGLERQGESMFAATVNSGEALLGLPGEGENGQLTPGALEMSNVDLAEEFTNLIVAQRGFQANSRGVTTSDEMLQELVQMKR